MKFLSLCVMLSVCLGSVHVSQVQAAQADLKKGKALYFTHCVDCHGPDGKGKGSWPFSRSPADLTAPNIQEKSNYELWESVHDGVPDSAMGSWKWVLSDREELHILTYIQSLVR